MGKRAIELLGLAGKAWFGLVAGAVLGFAGLIQAARGANESAYVLAIFAVVALAVVFAWVGYRALRERDAAASPTGPNQVVHHYNAPVSISMGDTASAIPTPPQRAVEASSTDDTPTIRLGDHVQIRQNEPPIIRNRAFQDAVIQGPLLVYGIGCTFDGVTFGIFGDDIESILWEVAPDTTKLGIVVLEGCKFKNCKLQQIAFVGTQAELDKLRKHFAAVSTRN